MAPGSMGSSSDYAQSAPRGFSAYASQQAGAKAGGGGAGPAASAAPAQAELAPPQAPYYGQQGYQPAAPSFQARRSGWCRGVRRWPDTLREQPCERGCRSESAFAGGAGTAGRCWVCYCLTDPVGSSAGGAGCVPQGQQRTFISSNRHSCARARAPSARVRAQAYQYSQYSAAPSPSPYSQYGGGGDAGGDAGAQGAAKPQPQQHQQQQAAVQQPPAAAAASGLGGQQAQQPAQAGALTQAATAQTGPGLAQQQARGPAGAPVSRAIDVRSCALTSRQALPCLSWGGSRQCVGARLIRQHTVADGLHRVCSHARVCAG